MLIRQTALEAGTKMGSCEHLTPPGLQFFNGKRKKKKKVHNPDINRYVITILPN